MSQIFYFKPTKVSDDIIQMMWEAPTLLEKYLIENLNKKMWADIGRETGVRTGKENNSYWLRNTMIADALNLGGLEMAIVLSKTLNAPWTKDSVHECLIKPLLKAQSEKTSSTQAAKGELSETGDLLLRELGEKFGLEYIPWPSEETKPRMT